LYFLQIEIAGGLRDGLPQAFGTLPVEAFSDGVVLAEASGQIGPRDSGLEHEDDGVDEEPVVYSNATGVTLLARQQAMNGCPLGVG
jgi:hypothetical protein